MSYISAHFHCVFSTKERRPFITPNIRTPLWQYMGGIARQNGMRALGIGGVEDHAHLLLSLPSTIPIAKAMQLIKGGSSHWIHDAFPEARSFAWQKEYAAFSVSFRDQKSVLNYIRNQAEHHRKISFKEELIGLLQAFGVEYDERYLWA